ncbi:MAG TPA: hypothetical protein VGO91_04295 [Pyrinomonadaceae bacterium]|jgi:hypothetical protein|nr:hypothetical protein [Pyrinomonadaceae bacterium]
MKKTLSILLLMLLASTATSLPSAASARETAPAIQQTQTAASPLTNKDVQDMVKSGLAPQIIVAKIKASATNFDTSPAALQELKTAGVPDVVMMMMVQPAGPSVSSNSDAGGVEVKVADGTQLEVELASNVSSNTAKEGDIVDFTVVSPVVVNGLTIIEKGAPAKARIAAVKKAGYWGKAGRVGWAMQDVLAADGTRIPLRMESKLTGDSKGGTVATGVVVTSIVFFPAAPFWGFKKGKNAVFPAGKRFPAFVHGDVTIKGRPTNEPAPQPVSEKPAAPAPAARP